mmetsp:Transcript_19638/g.38362  ORF Transcript_19638/g.38362 Transcript_19638/m.38362 type:complete len:793 (+) Transcript_19638:108-2486(+)
METRQEQRSGALLVLQPKLEGGDMENAKWTKCRTLRASKGALTGENQFSRRSRLQQREDGKYDKIKANPTKEFLEQQTSAKKHTPAPSSPSKNVGKGFAKAHVKNVKRQRPHIGISSGNVSQEESKTHRAEVKSVDQLLESWRARRASRATAKGQDLSALEENYYLQAQSGNAGSRGIRSNLQRSCVPLSMNDAGLHNARKVNGLRTRMAFKSPLSAFALESVSTHDSSPSQHLESKINNLTTSASESLYSSSETFAVVDGLPRRWSRAARLSELQHAVELMENDLENVNIEEDLDEKIRFGIAVDLRWAFARWRHFLREVQFEEIKDLTAGFHFDINLSQRCFTAWKLFVLDRQWQQAVDFDETRMLAFSWAQWCDYTMERRSMRKWRQQAGFKRLKAKQRERILRQHIIAWVNFSKKRQQTRTRGEQVHRELWVRKWIKHWRRILDVQRCHKMARIFMRHGWNRLCWRWKVWKSWNVLGPSLDSLRRTMLYRKLMCTHALRLWRGFVQGRRLAAYYGDLRGVLLELQHQLVSRRKRRWWEFYRRNRARRGFQGWRAWILWDKHFKEIVADVRQKHLEQQKMTIFKIWQAATKSRRAVQSWSSLAQGLLKKSDVENHRLNQVRGKLSRAKTGRLLIAWRLVVKASRHHRHSVGKHIFEVLFYACARRRLLLRMAATHAARRQLVNCFSRWIVYSADQICWRRAGALHRCKLLVNVFREWRQFVDERVLERAHDRSMRRQLELGWFAQVRLEAARTYHRTKSQTQTERPMSPREYPLTHYQRYLDQNNVPNY